MTVNPRLVIPSNSAHLPIATALVEHSVKAFGFDESVAMSLVLATEEIVMGLSIEEKPLTIEVRDGLYFAELEFSFSTSHVPLASLNMTSATEVRGEEDFEKLGWVVAARTVDRFLVEHKSNRVTTFQLRKNREYPVHEGQTSWPEAHSPVAEIREAKAQELHLFAQRVSSLEHQTPLVDFFHKPGKLVDMVASGDYQAYLAVNSASDPLGGVVLDRRNPETAVMHGPYLFEQPMETARVLLHKALSSLARTSARGLITEQTEALLPESEMEVLGRRTLRFPDGTKKTVTALYRDLHEDEGRTVWVAPWLKTFLQDEYERLDLPREVQTWLPAGTSRQPHSVLSCDFSKRRAEVILRPVLAGDDAMKNLKEHVEQLREGIYHNIVFHLDLGQTDHMAFAQALECEGFKPCYIEPSREQGDLLVLQWEGS